MRLLLFGATGHLGQILLEQALGAGHEITAFVRRPGALDQTQGRLRTVVGDVLDAQAVDTALPGHDAVLSALGPRGRSASADVLSRGTQHIVAAMEATGVRRLISVAAAGVLQVDDHTLVRDLPSFPVMFREISAAHLHAFETLRASTLDWTLVCPPRLRGGAHRGQYRVQAERALSGSQEISTRDAAHFILGELDTPRFVRARVALAD